jgi:hypothetical protein
VVSGNFVVGNNFYFDFGWLFPEADELLVEHTVAVHIPDMMVVYTMENCWETELPTFVV